MKIHKSTELTLDYFLRLPRRAQLIFFEHMGDGILNDGGFQYSDYFVTGAFYTEECKSPVEQILCMALSVLSFGCVFTFECQKNIHTSSGNHYIADFAITRYNKDEDEYSTVVLIECDGHDFHEKTKAQVTKRNERDYDLKVDGYDILHYNGSQIYDDPFKCAKEIYEYCGKKLGIETWVKI